MDVLGRPQAVTLGDVPGTFGATLGTLEDPCLSVREDTVVLLNWRTYMPSQPSGFQSLSCLSVYSLTIEWVLWFVFCLSHSLSKSESISLSESFRF